MDLRALAGFDLRPTALARSGKSELRIGMIGLGRFVRNNVLDAYLGQGYNVVAAADVDQDSREMISRRYPSIRTYRDYRTMLDDGVDVIDINIPWSNGASSTRLAIVKEAAARGVHVQLAKPLADTYRTCVEIVETAEQHGITLAVNQNSRFAPAFFAAGELVRRGVIGDVLSASLCWQAARGLQHLADFDVLLDVTVHQVDVVLSWFDQQPVEVYARRTKISAAGSVVTAVLSFADGSTALINDDFASELSASWPFRIVGEQGTIEGTDDIEIPEPGQPRMQKGFVRVGLNEFPRTSMELPLGYRYAPQAYAASMGDLLHAIADKRTPWASGRNVLRTMRTLFAVTRSIETQSPVVLDRADDMLAR